MSDIEEKKELVLADSYDLDAFRNDWKSLGKMMASLCIRAYQLSQIDAHAFKIYLTEDIGVSRQTAERMIAVGEVYYKLPFVKSLEYTKVSELMPIKEEIKDFMETSDLPIEKLNTMSQKSIRESVKSYLAAGVIKSHELKDQTVVETARQRRWLIAAEKIDSLKVGHVIDETDRASLLTIKNEIIFAVEGGEIK